MSEMETPPWHQCKGEPELRFVIAHEIHTQMHRHLATLLAEGTHEDVYNNYLRAISDAMTIARGGLL